MLGGLAGSLASIAAATAVGDHEPSVGASAAFLGLLGALVMAPRSARGTKLPLDKVLAVVLVMQVVAPALGIGGWVSSAAHVAGLSLGAAYGYLLGSRARAIGTAPVLKR